MSEHISLTKLRARRLSAQRLSSHNAFSDAGELLANIVAIQAQDSRAATLSIRPRTSTLTADDVRIAREESRSLVLTWCMRGTMHLLPAADVGWLIGLLGPVFIQKTRARYQELDLSADTRARALYAIAEILSKRGIVARPALRDLLTGRGFPTEGQAFIHLVRAAALHGMLCFGPEVEGEQSFVLLSDWIESEYQPDDPFAELARRYLRAYGPATAVDMANWSGISPRDAREGFESIAEELVELELDGSLLWMLADQAEPTFYEPIVRLLPAFDTLLLGYDGRAWMLTNEHAPKVHPGGGIIKPTLLVDGEIVGTWSAKNRGQDILVEPFAALTDEVVAGIEAEAADIGRFLGADTTLSFT